jgi:hypothetical protein
MAPVDQMKRLMVKRLMVKRLMAKRLKVKRVGEEAGLRLQRPPNGRQQPAPK